MDKGRVVFVGRCLGAIGSILPFGRQLAILLLVTLMPTVEAFHLLSAPPSMHPPAILGFLIRRILLFLSFCCSHAVTDQTSWKSQWYEQ